MHIKILTKSERRKIIENLETNFGIEKLKFLFFKTGKGRVRGFSGSLSREEISEINQTINVEMIGKTILSESDSNIRFNFDALNINEIKNQINKSTIELDKARAEKWLSGDEIKITKPEIKQIKGKFAILTYKDNIIGMGKLTDKNLLNYVPKERRVRKI